MPSLGVSSGKFQHWCGPLHSCSTSVLTMICPLPMWSISHIARGSGAPFSMVGGMVPTSVLIELSSAIRWNSCSVLRGALTAYFADRLRSNPLACEMFTEPVTLRRLLTRVNRGPIKGTLATTQPMWDSTTFHIATSTFDHVISSKSSLIDSTSCTIRIRQMLRQS